MVLALMVVICPRYESWWQNNPTSTLQIVTSARPSQIRYTATNSGSLIVWLLTLKDRPLSLILNGEGTFILIFTSLPPSKQESFNGSNDSKSLHFILTSPLLLFIVPGIRNILCRSIVTCRSTRTPKAFVMLASSDLKPSYPPLRWTMWLNLITDDWSIPNFCRYNLAPAITDSAFRKLN